MFEYKDTGRISRTALIVALIAGVLPIPALAADETDDQEIIVTANRRSENVQDVATSIDVIGGQSLERRGQDDFEDYLATVSSLGYSRDTRGGIKIGIRGVSNVAGTSLGIGSSVSTVGLYLNDVPIQGAAGLPDLGLYDLERIEVLKGPQGTLYGEGSMGGAIKMILAQPELDTFRGKAQGEVSLIDDADASYTVHGSLSLPIIADKLGLRVTGSYRDDAGFVRNDVLGRDDGDTRAKSIRAMLRAKPSEDLTIDLLGLYQKVDQKGFNDITVGAEDLHRDIPDEVYNHTDFKLGAATISYDFGGVSLIAATAYWKSNTKTRYRNPGAAFDNYSLFAFGLDGFTQDDAQGIAADIDQKAFTQEVRLTSTSDGPLRWTVGGIYRHLKLSGIGSDAVDSALINGQINAAAAGIAPILAMVGGTVQGALLQDDFDVYDSNIRTRFEGIAGYANASYDISDSITLEFGLRLFEDKYTFHQEDRLFGIYAYDAAFFLGPIDADGRSLSVGTFDAKAKDNGLIPKFGVSWKPRETSMVYAQVTKGFRDGGANFVGQQQGVPRLFKSDASWNYEVGTKNTFWDGRITANAAFYWIDWSDIQLRVGGFPSYLVNAGDARIYGAELSLSAKLSSELQTGFNLGLLNSKLKKVTNTSVNAVVGEPIPAAPKTTFSAWGEYRKPIGDLTGVLRLDYEYRSKQVVDLITTTKPRDEYFVGDYGIVKVQAGIEADGWSGYLFVNNLFDSRGQVGRNYIDAGFPGYTPETTAQILRPRAFGLRVGVDF